ncbi:MAG TPA: nodulation protein NfeD [Thermomicrobiales bacterium]|nr:nodulation protein NfeD [Thermomicrobiales bacterium]
MTSLTHLARPPSINQHHILWRLLGTALVLAGLVLTGIAGAFAQGSDAQPHVGLIDIDGTITPVMATYVGRGLDRSADRGDSAVILRMDTPGGLSSAMDDIVSDILASPIPVIVYVAPEGARAASAGVYITYSAHVAAMAPATNIGSATPVNLGDESNDDNQSTMDRKVINDAVAKIRGLAERRGRNADWAEAAVRDADNITASVAVEKNVVDFIAGDLDSVLAQADGRSVVVRGQPVTVETAGASVSEIDMSFFEKLLQVVTDPNIAFVLVSLGTLAIVFEIANPGGIGPGAVGGLMLVTGFYALGTLDTNWAGLALMGLAFMLFVIDVFVPTHGILTITGIISFLFGGLLLSNTRNDDVLEISRVVIFTITALMGVFFLFLAGSAWRSHGRPPSTGESTLIGAIAVVRQPLEPDGMVFIQGELWQATSTDGPVERGHFVRILGIDGLRLTVTPVTVEAGVSPEALESAPG